MEFVANLLAGLIVIVIERKSVIEHKLDNKYRAQGDIRIISKRETFSYDQRKEVTVGNSKGKVCLEN